MKRTIALLLPLVVAAAAATVHGDDKAAPAPNSVVIAITTRQPDPKGTKDNPKPPVLRKWQVPQYSFVSVFQQWGFKVESRVKTAWDAKFPKDVKVVVPAKEGDAVPAAGPAGFTIEGTIDIVKNEITFYDQPIDVIAYIGAVNVTVKDAQGKELKKIAWKDYVGNNKDAGDEAVIKAEEERVVKFLTVDIFSIKEIADLVPKEKRPEFEKFLAHEKEQRDKFFDDFENHKEKKKDGEKKDGDEKK